MSAEDNIKTVQAAYEAFGRGDVVGIQELCTDDVDWAAEAVSMSAPWYGAKQGKAGVGAFFEAFGSTSEVLEFTPLVFTSNDSGDVMTVVRFRVQTRATGKTAAMNLHHHFALSDGKIAYYRGSEDTEQTAERMRG